jgi:hypothetical protein
MSPLRAIGCWPISAVPNKRLCRVHPQVTQEFESQIVFGRSLSPAGRFDVERRGCSPARTTSHAASLTLDANQNGGFRVESRRSN